MPIVGLTLATVAHLCAPRVSARTTLAVISVESNGKPWTIGDNDARRSYYPGTKGEAIRIAASLLAEHHNVDMGLMQINSMHLAARHLTLAQVFDPCVNVAVGSDILSRSYRAAVETYGPGEVALTHAFQIYNSGHADGAPAYARSVWSAGITLARSGW